MCSKDIKLSLFALLALFFSGCATVPYQPKIIRPAPVGVYHVVGSSQTLYSICKAYAVDMQEVMRLNNIQNPNQIGVGEKLFIPHATAPLQVKPFKPQAIEPVERLVGQRHYRIKWRSITLHHSGTLVGNAEAFDRNHRKRGLGGLFYHFIIDNGTEGSGNGEIEVGWRWIRQKEVNRRRDIQVCLVGNFNKQEISEAQFNSLIRLLKVLTKQYSIPLSNIRRHKDVKGKVTECPGKAFPLKRVLAELGRA